MISFIEFLVAVGWCIRHWKLIAFLLVLHVGLYQWHEHQPTGATATVVSLGGDVTPTSWAGALLGRLGDQATPDNVRAVVAWERAEGGHWANSAHYNPLNDTEQEFGSYAINSAGCAWSQALLPGHRCGVQAYTSWDQGLGATVNTLNNGYYAGILSALRAGNCAACVADAVGRSPWGTGRFAV